MYYDSANGEEKLVSYGSATNPNEVINATSEAEGTFILGGDIEYEGLVTKWKFTVKSLSEESHVQLLVMRPVSGKANTYKPVGMTLHKTISAPGVFDFTLSGITIKALKGKIG